MSKNRRSLDELTIEELRDVPIAKFATDQVECQERAIRRVEQRIRNSDDEKEREELVLVRDRLQRMLETTRELQSKVGGIDKSLNQPAAPPVDDQAIDLRRCA